MSREPTQFSSLKGKERNPPGWIRVHALDGGVVGGGGSEQPIPSYSCYGRRPVQRGLRTLLTRASARLVGENVGAEGVPSSGHLL